MQVASAATAYRDPFLAGLRPDRRLSVSAWAEEHRVLTPRASAMPGRWRNALTPYLVEVMDALGADHPCRRVVFMKGAQVGGTEAGNNWLGYVIASAPAPTMYVLPTVELAKQISQQRIEPLIADSPELSKLVRDRRSRDSGNTVLRKEFPNGLLVLTGANSATGLRSMPARNVFGDEVDAWPGDVDGEGDPILLAERGTRTFARHKVLLVSTPTIEGRSRIAREFNASDRSYFHVPCPECGQYQRLRWANVKWEKGEPASACYACEECGVLIPEHRKGWMLARGKWVAEVPERSATVRGFHLSALYSPLGWYSWADAAAAWEKAQGNPEALRTFVNLVLGECWEERGDAPDYEDLMRRAEDYPIGTVPDGGLVLTAGVDVQADRVELEVVAWGEGRVSWSVDYVVLSGDTAATKVWDELAALVGRSWPHASGCELPLSRVALDTGYRTQTAYTWTRARRSEQVLAIKGMGSLPALLGQPKAVEVSIGGRKLRRGVKLWPVGTDVAKSELYGWLRLKPPARPEDPFPPGYCHLPKHPEEWFRQLTAEQLVPRVLRGRRVYTWELKYERNEALDCRVYARAAASALGIDRWRPEQWAELRANLSSQSSTPQAQQRKGRERERRARGQSEGWLDRWN